MEETIRFTKGLGQRCLDTLDTGPVSKQSESDLGCPLYGRVDATRGTGLKRVDKKNKSSKDCKKRKRIALIGCDLGTEAGLPIPENNEGSKEIQTRQQHEET